MLLKPGYFRHTVTVGMVANCGRWMIAAFGVTWRKAVRRILNTPPDTHNNLLPLLLGNTLPFFDDLCKRSSRFILECIQSESSLSRSVARFGIMAGLGNSFVVRNIVFLCSHFGWQFNEFVEGKK